MMPPSYKNKYKFQGWLGEEILDKDYVSYNVQAKIEDETFFGTAKYCDTISLNFKLFKDIWTTSTLDGFGNIELQETP